MIADSRVVRRRCAKFHFPSFSRRAGMVRFAAGRVAFSEVEPARKLPSPFERGKGGERSGGRRLRWNVSKLEGVTEPVLLPRRVPRTSQGQHIEASRLDTIVDAAQIPTIIFFSSVPSSQTTISNMTRHSRESNISRLLETCRPSSFFRVFRILYTPPRTFRLALSFSFSSCRLPNVIFTHDSLRVNCYRANE